MILLQRDIPDAEVLEQVKETGSALGLILSGDQSPSDYFLKIDRLINEIGMEHVMVVNEQPLLDGRGKEQMMGVISRMLEAGYEHLDNYLDYRMINLFSGTFIRVLEASK